MNVGRDAESPLYCVTASSLEQQTLLMDRLKQLHPDLPVVEETSEAGVLGMLLKMNDKELLKMGGLRRKDVKAFREFLRKKKLKKHPR